MKDNADPKIVIMVVGNKSDLSQTREVNEETAKEFAKSQNLFFFETSALDGTNVEKAFQSLLVEIYKQNATNTDSAPAAQPAEAKPEVVDIKQEPQDGKKLDL